MEIASISVSTRLRSKRGALMDVTNQKSAATDSETIISSQKPLKRARKSIGVNSEQEKSSVVTEQVSNHVSVPVKEDTSDKINETESIPLPCHKIRRSRPLPSKCLDPAQCLDIIDDMYAVYFDLEQKYSAKPYMSTQKDISAKMRSILVDWLIEVHYKFRLHTPTLWLCVNILDRYLSVVQVQRSKLQLVGVTALLIACKFEEVYPPEVNDCVFITDNAYDKPEILQMEVDILKQLDYQVCVPTGYHFLIRFLNSIQASDRTRFLASFYAERNLQESDMLNVPPHKFAAASIYAALKQQSSQFNVLKNSPSWNQTLKEESGLEESDVIELARNLVHHVSEEIETASRRRLVAAKKKYSNERYQNISALPLPVF